MTAIKNLWIWTSKSTARRVSFGSIVFVFGLWFYYCLPDPLFSDPHATVITDKNGLLLGARIADDGQWRFPSSDRIPEKVATCLLTFEDQYFYYHPGINLVSIFRALHKNIKAGKVVQGGSTISMQTIRLARKGQPRTLIEKLIEIVQAIRMEIEFSKDEILALYASNAPFGGNVVGLPAASWRYYQCSPEHLTWSQAATLAVLPNAPSMIHPGKNQSTLRAKRDKLLVSLMQKGLLTETDYHLALLEAIPQKPLPLPQNAYHLLMRLSETATDGRHYSTTIDGELQKLTGKIIDRHHQVLSANYIDNAAAIIIHVPTGQVRAYIGNASKSSNGAHVDIITAKRSTGSILKPFLYACMNQSGDLLPKSLVADIPTYLQGFAPQNYDLSYDGAVPATKALSRSLNIPAVKMLQQYGVARFREQLLRLGMTTLTKPADYYGLSLILGGAEGTLWDIAGMYASCSRIATNYWKNNHEYDVQDIHSPLLLQNQQQIKKPAMPGQILSAASVWLTYQALLEVNRPDQEGNWQAFSSSQRIAWKTGTSFGYRDAWAIGTTQEYVVGVWCGNADGTGRPGLVGVSAAAPILFDIFKLLPQSPWFEAPYDELPEIATCRQSGYRASIHCPETDTVFVYTNGLQSDACPYHQIVHLSENEKYQVTADCAPTNTIKHTSWFILPPVQAWYYKRKNPFYKTLPPVKSDCLSSLEINPVDFVFPKQGSKIFIPQELSGEKGKVVFEVMHRQNNAEIYWHLDGAFIGTTTDIHQIAIHPSYGKHSIVVLDQHAHSQERVFEIVSN